MSGIPATSLCLVEPAAFAFNPETAATNRFQRDEPGADIGTAARSEFNALVAALRRTGIGICVAPDSPSPPRPDALFPNNWVSFHSDGTVVLYPMHSPARRAERREAVIDCVKQELGFSESRRLDLTASEQDGRFLEGTGSLVLDHAARVAYACRSPRTNESLVREWARLMDFEPFVFDAATSEGVPVYHTNVLLWIGEHIAGAGLDWVDPAQRNALATRLAASGKDVLALDDRQLHAFAGNMLPVKAADGRRHLVMSASAAHSLHEEQRARIAAAGLAPIVSAVPTIERVGGGSVRCMLAEVPVQTGRS